MRFLSDIVSPSFPSSGKEMALVTELIFAASTNNVKEVERLIKEENVSPNCGDYDHRTALHVAGMYKTFCIVAFQ